MTTPPLSPRLLAALSVAQTDIPTETEQPFVTVDHADRRFRDAIKAGATPVAPPANSGEWRTATLADPTTGTTITIRSPLPVRG